MAANTLKEAIKELETDRASGASQLARFALRACAQVATESEASDVADLTSELSEAARKLAATRPSMAPLQNLLKRFRDSLETLPDDPADARNEAKVMAEDLARRSEEATDQAAQAMAEKIQSGNRIITHSNSSTLMRVFELCRDKDIHVIVSESRPLCEGRAVAEKLDAWGIPVTYITDAQMALWVQTADVALVGADSITPSGGVINKSGTVLLALAAKAIGIPFYVCCESFKRRPEDMGEVELEEMDPSELDGPQSDGISVRNIYFDITPDALINEIVTGDD